MKAQINCGCEECIKNKNPHRLTITGRKVFRAHGHKGTNEIIEDARSWEDIEAMYGRSLPGVWDLEFID